MLLDKRPHKAAAFTFSYQHTHYVIISHIATVTMYTEICILM